MKMVVNRYNHAEVAFCVYFECEYHNLFWCFILLVAQWKIDDIFWMYLQCLSAVFWLFYCLLVRHQSLKLGPISPCYLNVSSENLFTELGIMSIITYSSVCLQTGLSTLQSFSEGPCFQALMLHRTSVHLASLQDGNCFLLCISVTGDLWMT